MFEQASEDHPELVFGKIDTEAQQELAGSFGIQSIPTLMILRERVIVFSQPGALPGDALEDLISQAAEPRHGGSAPGDRRRGGLSRGNAEGATG